MDRLEDSMRKKYVLSVIDAIEVRPVKIQGSSGLNLILIFVFRRAVTYINESSIMKINFIVLIFSVLQIY